MIEHPHDRAAPTSHRAEIRYRVSAEGAIEAIEGPWQEFARNNEAPELADPPEGRSLIDFVTGSSTRELIRNLMAKVREEGRPLEIPYRCDAPHRRRFMRLRIEPHDEGTVLFRSWIEREEPREPVPLMEFKAPRSSELLKMCAWCNRFDVEEEWLEVEDAVDRLKLFGVTLLPDISHGVCPGCEEQVLGTT